MPSRYHHDPTSSQGSSPSHDSQLLRSLSDADSPFLPDSTSFARPPKTVLPDPAQFPDPYPFRHPHHHLSSTPPALSSGGSSSASTRSSTYTTSGIGPASGDYVHVHDASTEDDAGVGIGITSDDVVQLLTSHRNASFSSTASQSRVPIDQSRWSESYSGGSRSRSSSVVQSISGHEMPPPPLRDRASYDMGWQTVDERDEAGISEDETDEDPSLDHSFGDEAQGDEEERTSAAVIAEEGRGVIVRGDNVSSVQLQVQPGAN
jgi:hypothetical protein